MQKINEQPVGARITNTRTERRVSLFFGRELRNNFYELEFFIASDAAKDIFIIYLKVTS